MRRYELLPVGGGEADALRLPEPTLLTVTCSPRHGIDRTVAVAERLRAAGHAVVVHLAARMVRDRAHLDGLLERMAAAGIDDVFVIGGDAETPLGPFASAVALLPVLDAHPRRPARIGIAAYPEGHPQIDAATLESALTAKGARADYVVTQLCFDSGHLLSWLAGARERGLALPVLVGIPGLVDRRRLLEVSLLVGVGSSVSFLRKQRGLRRLMARPHHAAEALHRELVPLVGDPRWGIAGLHYFTFNRVVETWAWDRGRTPPVVGQPRDVRCSYGG